MIKIEGSGKRVVGKMASVEGFDMKLLAERVGLGIQFDRIPIASLCCISLSAACSSPVPAWVLYLV